MLSVGLIQFVLPEEQQVCMTTKSVAMLSNARTLTKLSAFGHCLVIAIGKLILFLCMKY